MRCFVVYVWYCVIFPACSHSAGINTYSFIFLGFYSFIKVVVISHYVNETQRYFGVNYANGLSACTDSGILFTRGQVTEFDDEKLVISDLVFKEDKLIVN